MNCINIIGYGVNVLEHLTLNAINVLKNSEVVLALANNNEIDALSQYCKHIISIKSLYKDGDRDVDNYYRIYKKVTSYLSEFEQVSLLVAGHPRLGVTLTKLFETQANKEHYTVNVSPGVSSFDTMLNDLKIDPLERGSVIIDVNRLLLFEYPLYPALDYFIYHISSIGNNKTDFVNPNANNNVDALKKYLLKYYDSSKEISMLQSASLDFANSKITSCKISDISEMLHKVNFLCSLFIQGDNKDAPINQTFYNSITS